MRNGISRAQAVRRSDRWWVMSAAGGERGASQRGHRLRKPRGRGFGCSDGSGSVCGGRGKERWDQCTLLLRRYAVQ